MKTPLSSSSWVKATAASSLILLGSGIVGVVDGFSRTAATTSNTRPLHLATLPVASRQLKSPCCPPSQISASPQDEQDRSDDNNSNNNNKNKGGDDDSIRKGLRRLAQLSLEDYDWRMSLFKEKEADRKVEQYLAGMLGEDASYVRPQDAPDGTIGPLGRAEKAAVEWLSQVIDEEGRRAQKIVSKDGKLVRPFEASSDDGALGPLGTLEKNFVEFLNLIRTSEKQRAKEGGLRMRPMEMDESNRGPLGQLELSVVSALRNIKEAELLRSQQSKLRGGELVRPIDVPGPLGDFELAVADMIQTERLRARDGKKKEAMVRPKDALIRGKLGEIEMQAVDAVRQLTDEERKRLSSIKRSLEEQRERLQDRRPMAIAKDSMLGMLEAILVGLLRAPAMLIGVLQRVGELMSSEGLGEKDQVLLESRRTNGDGGELNNNNSNKKKSD